MRGCHPSSSVSRALTFGLALLLCAANAEAEGTPIAHGTVELIAENPWIEKQGIENQGIENQRIAAGHKCDVGLRFQLEKGWHIYWVNPGDSGEPPRVEWHLPAGLTAGTIEWPTPQRFATSSSIVDYGYENAVLLIVPTHVDARLAAQGTTRLDAEVKLLVCSHEMCIPGKAELSLVLPIKSQRAVPDARSNVSSTAELFNAARKSLPRAAPANWRFSVADANDSFVLTAKLGHQVTQAVFFPLAESQIENAAPQKLVPIATGFRLTLRKSDQLVKPIERLKGVLVLSGDRSHLDQSYLIDVPFTKPGAARSSFDIGIHPVQSLYNP